MGVVARKTRSLLWLMRRPQQLRTAMRRNFYELRARVTGRSWFLYEFVDRVPFVCDLSNETSVRLFLYGYQEHAEIDIVRNWLRPDDLVVDVGANIGVLTAVYASCVGPRGRVLAIEPSPHTFAVLVESLERLGLSSVVPVSCCASDGAGVTSFFVSTSAESVPEEESMRVSEERRAQFRQVLTTSATLDSLVASLDVAVPPAAVKVDVEGAEPLVLRGASGILSSDDLPLVLIEIHRTALANFNFTPEDVLRFLPADRFDRYFIPRSISDVTEARRHGRMYRLDDVRNLPIYSNIIAIPTTGRFAARRPGVESSLRDYQSGWS
jgi:FkbM family methyltransferase